MKLPGPRPILLLIVLALAVVALWAALAALRPLPERTLSMATGPEGSAYAAFVQAGTTPAAQSPGLLSLGTMFYEPMWVFCRCEPQGLDFHEVLGKRVSIGPEGSATRELALRLMRMNGLDPVRFERAAFTRGSTTSRPAPPACGCPTRSQRRATS